VLAVAGGEAGFRGWRSRLFEAGAGGLARMAFGRSRRGRSVRRRDVAEVSMGGYARGGLAQASDDHVLDDVEETTRCRARRSGERIIARR
jgi:hypothetical protein